MIKNFTMSPANRASLIEKIQRLDPYKLWVCNIIEKKSKRTIEQNSRLWKLYTALGNYIGLDADEVHELMAYKFLRYQKEVNGKVEEFVKSTTKLNTAEMVGYQDAIERWGAEIGFLFDERWAA